MKSGRRMHREKQKPDNQCCLPIFGRGFQGGCFFLLHRQTIRFFPLRKDGRKRAFALSHINQYYNTSPTATQLDDCALLELDTIAHRSV